MVELQDSLVRQQQRFAVIGNHCRLLNFNLALLEFHLHFKISFVARHLGARSLQVILQSVKLRASVGLRSFERVVHTYERGEYLTLLRDDLLRSHFLCTRGDEPLPDILWNRHVWVDVQLKVELFSDVQVMLSPKPLALFQRLPRIGIRWHLWLNELRPLPSAEALFPQCK
jgi:hypothetical protein